MNTARIRRFLILVTFGLVLGLAAPIGAAAESPQPDDDPGSPVGRSDLALTNRLFNAVLNSADAEAASDLIAEDAVIQTNYGTFTGPQGLLDYASRVRQTYPDALFRIIDVTRSGDSLEIRWTMTASQILRGQQVFDFVIAISGTTTVTVGDVQITGVTQETEIVSGGVSTDTAYIPRPGIPY